MDTWRAVAHGLVGGGATGILLWGVILFISMGEGVPDSASTLVLAGGALAAGITLNLVNDMLTFPG